MQQSDHASGEPAEKADALPATAASTQACPRCLNSFGANNPYGLPAKPSRAYPFVYVCAACAVDEKFGRGTIQVADWPLEPRPTAWS